MQTMSRPSRRIISSGSVYTAAAPYRAAVSSALDATGSQTATRSVRPQAVTAAAWEYGRKSSLSGRALTSSSMVAPIRPHPTRPTR